MNILLTSDFMYNVAKYWYITAAILIIVVGLLVYAAAALNKLIADVRENSELKQARRKDDEDRLKKQRERALLLKEDMGDADAVSASEESAATIAENGDENETDNSAKEDSADIEDEKVPENAHYSDKFQEKEELCVTSDEECQDGLNEKDSFNDNKNTADDSSLADTKENFEDMATKNAEKETVKAKKETASEKKTSELKEKPSAKKAETKTETPAQTEETKTEVTAVSADKAEKTAKEIAEKGEIKAVYRVIYDKENKEWLIKKDGASRIIRRVKTKAEALELATHFAENQELNITVQKKDGKFQKKTNYRTMLNSDKSDN